MRKSLYRAIISVICGMLIIAPNIFIRTASAIESNTIAAAENENQRTDTPSKAVLILVVISVFTITCASSAVFTYKLRRKTSENKKENNSDDNTL